MPGAGAGKKLSRTGGTQMTPKPEEYRGLAGGMKPGKTYTHIDQRGLPAEPPPGRPVGRIDMSGSATKPGRSKKPCP
jgi:hypothetical protein